MYSEKTATFPKSNGLVVFPVHVVWSTFTAKHGKYLADNAYILLGFFLGGTAETKT